MNIQRLVELAKEEAELQGSGKGSTSYLKEIEDHINSPFFLNDLGERDDQRLQAFIRVYSGLVNIYQTRKDSHH